jgi:hypothetical protein
MNPLRPFASGLRRAIRWAMRTRRQQKRLDRYRDLFSRNNLLRDTPNPQYPQEVREFWEQHYGRPVNPLWHLACANVTGREDVRYVPNDTWFDEILPFFNKMSMHPAYTDKNLSSRLLGAARAPVTIVRRMHGQYYTDSYQWISREAALAAITGGSAEQIIKPSLTDNGVGIRKLEIVAGGVMLDGKPVTLAALEASHGADFLVQSRLRQHPVMAAPHPDSVNTIRLVTFRWNDDIRVLMAFARFGTGGSLTDNAGTGGVCCGIDDLGQLHATAVDEHGGVLEHHPTTGYPFGTRAVVPNYERLCQQALELHRGIWHFDIVSWDVAIDEQGEPVFVEFNVRGTSYLYQFATGKPLFGELTEAVLERMRDSRGKRFDEGFDVR